MKKKKFLFIMDPIEEVIPNKDTSYILMLEAFKRDISVYYCNQKDLFINQKIAHVSKAFNLNVFQYSNDNEIFSIKSMDKNIELKYFDVIFMRKDPPVDDEYIRATYILDMVKSDSLVVNNPSSLRAFNEKLSTLQFEDIVPNTSLCLGSDLEFINQWAKNCKLGIVIKPLNLCGGEGIQKFTFNQKEKVYLNPNETYILQEFISEVKQGDKRVILLDGEPIGAILRKSSKDSFICNFHSGGTPHKTEITDDDLRICKRIKTFIIKNGIYLAGIDIIGKYLTEINITSPTCVQEINRANKVNLEKNILDFIIHKT